MFYDQKTRNKLLKSLDLSYELRHYMGYPMTFSVPLSKIDYYQNIVDEKEKRDEEEWEKSKIRIQKEKEEEENKKKRKYSSDSNSNSDSDNENRYQRNKEKDEENKVDYIKVCQKCKWICLLCRTNFTNENGKIVTQTRARAHVKCTNKEMCPLCRNKLGNSWTNYICIKCRSKLSSFKCFNCNKLYK